MGLPNQLPTNFPHHCQRQGRPVALTKILELSSPLLCLTPHIQSISKSSSCTFKIRTDSHRFSLCVLVTQSSRLFATPWTAAHQASLSMRFSRQAYWSGLPFPSPGDIPDPGIKPGSRALQSNSLPAELQGKTHCKLVLTNFLIITRVRASVISKLLFSNCSL